MRQQAAEEEANYQEAVRNGAVCPLCDAVGCNEARHERGY